MASRILLELDAGTLRVAVARGAARAWEIVDSFAIEIEANASSEAMVAKLREAMLGRSIPLRGDLDLIVGRRDVELRELELPPAPPGELPGMVRFVARGEFTHFGDQSLLDYSPIRGSADSPWAVVAATLNQNLGKFSQDVAQGLNLKLRRILVRPWCVAHALFHAIDPEQATLVIDGGGESVEMSIWQAGHMLLARSFRPGALDPDSRQREIADEITRTLMTAGRATGRRPVDRMIVVGNENDFPIPKRDGLPPLQYAQPRAHRSRDDSASARKQVFAAHRGALNFLERPAGDMLDFLSPKRTEVKTTNWRKVGAWAAAAAALLAVIVLYVWSLLAGQAEEIAAMTKQLEDLKQLNAPNPERKWPGSEQVVGEAKLIDDWMAGRIDWLDELQQISTRLLTPDDAMVDSIVLTAEEQKSVVQLKGHLLDAETGTQIKTQLGARPFAVVPGNTRTDTKSRDYPLTFDYQLARDIDGKAVAQQILELARQNRLKPGAAPAIEKKPDSATSATGNSENGSAVKTEMSADGT